LRRPRTVDANHPRSCSTSLHWLTRPSVPRATGSISGRLLGEPTDAPGRVKVRNQCAVVPFRVIDAGCNRTVRAIIATRLPRVSGCGQWLRTVASACLPDASLGRSTCWTGRRLRKPAAVQARSSHDIHRKTLGTGGKRESCSAFAWRHQRS
jgi:hypothetical protein